MKKYPRNRWRVHIINQLIKYKKKWEKYIIKLE